MVWKVLSQNVHVSFVCARGAKRAREALFTRDLRIFLHFKISVFYKDGESPQCVCIYDKGYFYHKQELHTPASQARPWSLDLRAKHTRTASSATVSSPS